MHGHTTKCKYNEVSRDVDVLNHDLGAALTIITRIHAQSHGVKEA